MKKKILAIVSGVVSAVSILFIYDKWLNKSKIENKILHAESIQFFTKKMTPQDHHSSERFLRENPLAILLLVVLATILLFNNGLQEYMRFFQTSMIHVKYTTESFDGAVYPVDKVPKWTALTEAERSYSYSQLPASKFVTLPRYNVADFQKGLIWTAINERERNAYITYPVPNLGNYKLDGTEGTGSHTGLDIKLPVGTPIKSISRGVVTKAKTQSTGFGKHIVIMHKNVPDPQNSAKKITLFSAYAHLSQIKVKEGQQVQKGQIIGLAGATGMATTSHLHFQIDTADAPFHPYWPLSWSDVTSHGLSSFFEAVKKGVNIHKAKQYTVHPMNLVRKNIGYIPPTSSRLVALSGALDKEISRDSGASSRATTVLKPTTSSKTTTSSLDRIIRIPVRKNSRTYLGFKRAPAPVSNNRVRIASRRPSKSITTLHTSATKEPSVQKTAATIVSNNPPKTAKADSTYKHGNDKMWFEAGRLFVPKVTKTIKLFIKNKEIIPNGGVTIGTNSRDFIKISPTLARAEAFANGYLEIKVISNSDAPFKIIANAKGVSAETATFLAQPFTDISAIGKERTAAKYVKDNNIMKGYNNGEFKPSNNINRAEAVKVIVLANKISVIPAKKDFQDVDRSSWFANYVSTAFSSGIVSGYEGNLFKPANEVTVAEFLKMALVAREINPADTKNSPYRDVPAESWYEKYFSYARNNGLLSADSKGFIYPNKNISRIEAAYILYKLSLLN